MGRGELVVSIESFGNRFTRSTTQPLQTIFFRHLSSLTTLSYATPCQQPGHENQDVEPAEFVCVLGNRKTFVQEISMKNLLIKMFRKAANFFPGVVIFLVPQFHRATDLIL